MNQPRIMPRTNLDDPQVKLSDTDTDESKAIARRSANTFLTCLAIIFALFVSGLWWIHRGQ